MAKTKKPSEPVKPLPVRRKRMGKRVTLYRGDCLDVMSRIPDHSVDLVLCDLPYGTTQNSWDTVIDFEKLWKQYRRVAKPNAAFVLFTQQPFTSTTVMSNISMFRYEWVWQKNKATGHLNAKRMPMKAHENILVFYDKLPKYNPQGLVEKDTPTINPGSRGSKTGGAGGSNYGKSNKDSLQTHSGYPRDILTFDVDFKAEHHPTQKPVPLLEYLIRTYTDENMLVLDNTMGSGSTGVAAVNTKRKFIGIERDPTYFETSVTRLRQARRERKRLRAETKADKPRKKSKQSKQPKSKRK